MAININPGSPVRHVATFNTSTNWTAPAGCTLAFVSIHGSTGGGRGGVTFGADSNNNTGVGGAGIVSGAWVQVTPGSAHVVTIGAGGAGGAANNNQSATPAAGAVGGTTTFDTALSVAGGNGAPSATRNSNSVGTVGAASGTTSLTSLSPSASALARVATLAATQNTGAFAGGTQGGFGNSRYGSQSSAGNAGASGQIHIYI
jgi:hypothetical protein